MKSSIWIRTGAVVMIVALCVSALVFFQHQTSAHGVTMSNPAAKSSVVALPNYDVTVFARGNKSYFNPDSVDVAGKYVFIGYQNITAKDGTDNKTSTIVQYTRSGKVVHTFSILGHNDGLRFDPATKLLWATSNEDGNPRIVTINPENGKITPYIFPKTPHGGGYDDVVFIKGTAFIAASNPTLNSAGVNVFPAVDKIELKNGKAILTPVLNGNATATDAVSQQQVTLNLTDPDSMAIDNKGNLVLDSQGDSELITIHNPGTSNQTVERLTVGTQVDDTIWLPAKEGRLLVVDAKTNVTYAVTLDKTDFAHGTIYTEAPSDSGVAGFVGKVDSATGTISPVIIGLGSPTGMVFQPLDQ